MVVQPASKGEGINRKKPPLNLEALGPAFLRVRGVVDPLEIHPLPTCYPATFVRVKPYGRVDRGPKIYWGRWAEVRMADSLENRNTTLPACAEMVVLGKT